MPFIRCKFYSESGKPLGSGCLKRTCAFVHPEDSGWTSAPPPSFKARDKGGDPWSSKSWSDRAKRETTAPSPWETGGNAGAGAPDAGSGWDTGWDTGGSTSNQAPNATQPGNPSGWDASSDWSRAGATFGPSTSTKHDEDGRAAGANKTSRWGNAGDDGWGRPSWGPNKGTGNAAASGSQSTWNNGWDVPGWGDNKDTGKNVGYTQGNPPDEGWGVGWGNDDRATIAWGTSESTVADNQAERETGRRKEKGKVVIVPPRIRIPDKEDRKAKMSGSNNEPLGLDSRGESRNSNFAGSSITMAVSTPAATLTPTDSIRGKRKRDVSSDDKLEVFKDYIKTWERAVRTRFLLAEAEVKRDRWFRTQKSARYARIGEAGRKRLDDQRAECDKEVDLQREKLSGAITSLVDFHDAISSNLDLGQRYHVDEEMQKFISESKTFVDEARTLLVARVLESKGDVQSNDIQKHIPGMSPTPIDALRSQVRDLEERFEQARTELTLRRQRDIRSEINELLTAKILALRVARQQEIDRLASQPRSEVVIPPGALKNMEDTAQQVSKMETKVPDTVEDIRVLLFRVDAMAKRVSELEEEVSMNKEACRQVQSMAAEKEAAERRMDDQLQVVREKFEQLVASQSARPVAETADLQDALVVSLRPVFETVLDKFYEQEVRPTIESLQQAVVEASDRHQEEAIKVLWGRIQPAMNMVAGVSQWLDSQELGLTAPVDEAPTVATA